jgi:hypothetical protein
LTASLAFAIQDVPRAPMPPPRVRAASCRNLPPGFASWEKAGNLVHRGECGL